MAKLRKRRPTEADAELFLRQGEYSVGSSDYIDPKERLAQLDDLEDLFHDLWRQELRATRRLDLLILKCHIVIEIFLNRLLLLSAHNETDFEKERFTFSQKVTLAHAFALSPDPVLIPTLDCLNKVRNQIAHGLQFDMGIVNKIVRYNSELSIKEVTALTNTQRAAAMRRIVAGICGHIVGAVTAAHTFELSQSASKHERRR